LLLVAQQSLAGRANQGLGTEQVVEQLRSTQAWPDPLQGGLELSARADGVRQLAQGVVDVGLVVGEATAVLDSQSLSQFAPDGRTSLVVVARSPASTLDDLLRVTRAQHHDGPT